MELVKKTRSSSSFILTTSYLSECNKFTQIADFGMSRDLANENYYRSHGGKIPVKWTAPEVMLATSMNTA